MFVLDQWFPHFRVLMIVSRALLKGTGPHFRSFLVLWVWEALRICTSGKFPADAADLGTPLGQITPCTPAVRDAVTSHRGYEAQEVQLAQLGSDFLLYLT